VTVIFFGPDRRDEFVHELRALAIGAKLPVLLVEIERPREIRRGSRAPLRKPAALEYPSIPVDPLDAIAVYRIAHESIARAREGGGPTHIVGTQWQPVMNGRGRTAHLEPLDAIRHLEDWLMARGLPVAEWRQEISAELEATIDASIVRNAADCMTDEDEANTQAIA